jgi:hypothetical protein
MTGTPIKKTIRFSITGNGIFTFTLDPVYFTLLNIKIGKFDLDVKGNLYFFRKRGCQVFYHSDNNDCNVKTL